MINLTINVIHVQNFSPTDWWKNRIEKSLKKIEILVRFNFQEVNSIRYGLDNDNLHSLMHQFDQPIKSKEITQGNWFLSLIIGHTYTLSGYYGKMFDDIGPRYREGCAVFLDPIKNQNSFSEREKIMAHTAIHEIGHIFTFRHPKNPDTDDSVMLKIDDAKGKPNWPSDIYFDYNEDDKKYFMENINNELCKPGGDLPFGHELIV